MHGGHNVTISAAPYKLLGNQRQFHAFSYENATHLPFWSKSYLFHVAISPVCARFIRIERFIVESALENERRVTTTNALDTYQAIVVDSIDITSYTHIHFGESKFAERFFSYSPFAIRNYLI